MMKKKLEEIDDEDSYILMRVFEQFDFFKKHDLFVQE